MHTLMGEVENSNKILSEKLTDAQMAVGSANENDSIDCELEKLNEKYQIIETKLQEANEEKQILSLKVSNLQQEIENERKEREKVKCENERILSNLEQILFDKEEVIEAITQRLNENRALNLETAKQSENLQEIIMLKEMAEKDLWKELENMREISDNHLELYQEDEVKIKDLNKANEELKTKLEETVDELEAITAVGNELKVGKSALESENASLKEELKEANLKQLNIGELKLKLQETVKELDTLNSAIAELEEFNIKLETENTSLKVELKQILEKLNKCDKLSVEIQGLQEQLQNHEELVSSVTEEVNNMQKERDEAIQKLDYSLKEFKEINSKLENSLQVEEEKCKKLETLLIEQEKKMRNFDLKSANEVEELSSILDEKGSIIMKMASQIEFLDKIVNETQEELESRRTKGEILEKEIAALREARTEELTILKLELEEKELTLSQKEEETMSLQQEIKRLLKMSISSEVPEKVSKKAVHVKEEIHDNSEVLSLQEKLRESELEMSKLVLQLSSIQLELVEAHETTRSLQESQLSVSHLGPPMSSNKKCLDDQQHQLRVDYPHISPKSCKSGRGRARKTRVAASKSCQNSETSEIDSGITPVKPTRIRTGKKDILSWTPAITNSSLYNSPLESLKLTLDTSEGEDNHSLPRTRSTRARRTRVASSRYNDSFETNFKVPETRKKCLNVDDDCYGDESDNEEEGSCVPSIKTSARKAPKNKQKTSRSSSKIYNPHIENKENKLQDVSSKADQPPAQPLQTKTRRRRPLYNLGTEEPYECSPNLVPLNINDSPHTVVRRKLRSKAK